MTKEEIITQLQELFKLNTKEELDKTTIQKNIYLLLRECMNENIHQINIGDFYLELNPENLNITYENTLNRVELSNQDIYYETICPLNTSYFVISSKQDKYLDTNPYIEVNRTVLNMNGDKEVHIELTLYSNKEDKITNYLELPSNYSINIYNENDPLNIIVVKPILIDEPITKISDIFKKDLVRYTIYDSKNNEFIDTNEDYQNDTYNKYLPSLNRQKEIVSLLYNTITNFYIEYIK